jgi:hypothetical protein
MNFYICTVIRIDICKNKYIKLLVTICFLSGVDKDLTLMQIVLSGESWGE